MRFATTKNGAAAAALKWTDIDGQLVDGWLLDRGAAHVEREGALSLSVSAEGTFGRVELPASTTAPEMQASAHAAYASLLAALHARGLTCVQLWNYLPNETSRAQRDAFERGRHAACRDHWSGEEHTWPTPLGATVLVTDAQVVIECFAVEREVVRLENKALVPWYRRARGVPASAGAVLDNDGQRLLFTSPCDARKEDRLLHPGDLRAQVFESVDNLRILISQFNLRNHGVAFGFGLEDLQLLRVYYQNDQDREQLEAMLEAVVDEDCQLTYLRGALAEPEALVALEGIFLKKGESRARKKYRRVNGKIRVESLEFHVVEHCNLRCDQCDAMSPFNAPMVLSLERADEWLTFLARHMRADIFKLMGGEPLMHPDLVALIDVVRRSGITEVIRLTTNGLLLHKMPDAFWRGLDRLTVSNYASAPMRAEHVAMAHDKAAAFDVVLNLKRIDEFNSMMLSRPIESSERVQQIYDDCWIRHRSIVVRRGRLFKCTRVAYMDDFVNTFDVALGEGDPRSFHVAEGIALDADFGDAALAYLGDDEPLAACRYCLGASGQLIPQRQLTRREVETRSVEEGTLFQD